MSDRLWSTALTFSNVAAKLYSHGNFINALEAHSALSEGEGDGECHY